MRFLTVRARQGWYEVEGESFGTIILGLPPPRLSFHDQVELLPTSLVDSLLI